MSIWCSWDHIGTEDGRWFTVDEDGTRTEVVQTAERGDVRAYADGWSNHYPTDGFDDPTALVAIAHIPAWCVPGRRETHMSEYDEVAPWVRLDVHADGALTWWTDGGEKPEPAPAHASVVLDEEAARSLRDDLTQWLDTPKVQPIEEDDR